MSHRKNKGNEKEFTRREFLKTTGMAGAALGVTAAVPSLVKNVYAQQKKDFILIGHPNPSTGPLAGFGEASPWADEKAINAINKALPEGQAVRLDVYHVEAITGGTDAAVNVEVWLRQGGKLVTSRGTNEDIVMASVDAYLKGVNVFSGMKKRAA